MISEQAQAAGYLIAGQAKVLTRGRLRVNMDKAVELPKFTKLTRNEPEESED